MTIYMPAPVILVSLIPLPKPQRNLNQWLKLEQNGLILFRAEISAISATNQNVQHVWLVTVFTQARASIDFTKNLKQKVQEANEKMYLPQKIVSKTEALMTYLQGNLTTNEERTTAVARFAEIDTEELKTAIALTIPPLTAETLEESVHPIIQEILLITRNYFNKL